MSPRGKTISFTVEGEGERERLNRYAREKGFTGASSLARFALYQYISRYPAKDARAVQPEASEGK